MSHLREFIPLLKKYIDFLKREFGDDLVSVCLFGSIARGDFKENSDIDMLIVIKGLPTDIGYRIRRISHIKRKLRETEEYKALKSRNLPRLISEVIFTPEEIKKHPPILLDITIDGIILYDKDNFLKKELEKLREKLSRLGAKRVKSKHGWYWILKPNAKFGEVIKI